MKSSGELFLRFVVHSMFLLPFPTRGSQEKKEIRPIKVPGSTLCCTPIQFSFFLFPGFRSGLIQVFLLRKHISTSRIFSRENTCILQKKKTKVPVVYGGWNCKALTGKILVFFSGSGRLVEVVVDKRYSHIEIQLH